MYEHIIVERLDAVGRITLDHTPETLLEDPQLKAAGFFQEVEHPSEGAIRTMAVPHALVALEARAGPPGAAAPSEKTR